jgi:nucleotide-binding universal stress UspA family protein
VVPSALTEPVALLLLAATLAFAVVRPRGLPEAVVAIPAERISVLSDQAAAELLAAAEAQLGRPARRQIRSGRVERLVVEAAQAADLLVVARDGDRHRLGPASLGPATRFVVDHAPCPVLLVWPEATPAVDSLPPPPPHPPAPGPPPPLA